MAAKLLAQPNAAPAAVATTGQHSGNRSSERSRANDSHESLSTDRSERKIDEKILKRARELAEQKYGTESWLRKR